METFKSPEVIVNRTDEELFKIIGDLNNLKELMPSTIQNFESTESTCSLKMKGLPELNFKLVDKIPYSKISLTAEGSQIPFSLDCLITAKNMQCQAQIKVNIELNMMMKTMVEKPLTQFLDVLASKMASL